MRGVEGGQARADRQTGLEGLKCLGMLSLLQEDAYAFVSHGDVALPDGVAGIQLGRSLGKLQALSECSKRVVQSALQFQHITDLVVCDGKIVLPFAMVGGGFGQALGNDKTLLEGCHCRGEIALLDQRLAKLAVADGMAALPTGVAGIGLSQSFHDGQTFTVRLLPFGEITWAINTSPTLLCAIERACCHPALPGSEAAKRLSMARLWR